MDNEKELTVADLIKILKGFKQDSNIEIYLDDTLLKKIYMNQYSAKEYTVKKVLLY